ncbi:hypothetical protein NAC44_19070 [Allorhizobium sp. BGMRC 0089]|uniref:hypothetical protein n=1 Tax=Allorhizobium sonneratiae TaxID=2934936 RepID=UPI0020348DC8|nr:hypothetical protein [Allorhizobium sonneratiae]MCM2294432.1 hypothetical protein [Allorhizobium sonneratiae]
MPIAGFREPESTEGENSAVDEKRYSISCAFDKTHDAVRLDDFKLALRIFLAKMP